MIEKILTPNIGDFKNVEIIEVLVTTGDSVTKEQTLLTLESDKATMEIPSPIDGVITEILVKVGDRISTGDHIVNANTDEKPSTPKPKENEQESAATATTNTTHEKIITVPNIGDFKNVEIIEILVTTGDSVTLEQALLTLESDKATMEIPSPFPGKITQILVQAGDKISEGDKIAVISTESEIPASPLAPTSTAVEAPTENRPAAPQASAPSTPSPAKNISDLVTTANKPHAGPAVRHFARQLGVDLTQVSGSGRKGRILKTDVEQYVKTSLQSGSAMPQTSIHSLSSIPSIDFSQFGEIELQALSRINKLSAAHLHRCWINAPHVTQCEEADITEMEEFRQSLADEAKKKNIKVTPLVFFIKVAVASLKAFPRFNASLHEDGETLVLKKYFHIGIAVDTPNGLMVPVIRDADQKGIFDLAAELAEISTMAREGKLKKENLEGGCFTLSSLGGIGGSHFTPIINLPEVAIMGISRSSIKPFYDGQEFKPRLMLPLSLSYDHRVIDGAAGARFVTHYSKSLRDLRRLLL